MGDAPLFRVLSRLLGRPPVVCFCNPLNQKGQCACGACGKLKHPRPDRILTEPPLDHTDKSDMAAARERDGRFGVMAGPNGLIVIDVDCKGGKKGFESFAALGPMPDTLVQITPSGGKHYFYRMPESRRGQNRYKGSEPLGKGIDVLIGPNDLALAGAGYQLLEIPEGGLPELPEHVFDMLPIVGGGHGLVGASTYHGRGFSDLYEHPEALAWAKSQFARYCTYEVRTGGTHNRNEQLGQLGAKARAYGLPPEESIEIAFINWNARCEPPLDSIEDPEFGKRFHHSWESGYTDLGGAMYHRLSLWGEELVREAPPPPEPPPDAPPPAPGSPFDATPRKAKDPEHIYGFRCVNPKGPNGKVEIIRMPEIKYILRNDPAWKGVFEYDDFSACIRAVDPPMALEAERKTLSTNDASIVRDWLTSVLGKDASTNDVYDCIVTVAKERTYHAVRDYLDALPTQTQESAEVYLDGICLYQMRITNLQERLAIIRQLIGSVARIYKPGCRLHSCIILTGPEGVGKSTLIENLYGVDWFTSSSMALGKTDTKLQLVGRWGVELAELSGVQKTERTQALAFVSSGFDDFRKPYGRETERHDRTCVFWATTNDEQMLEGLEGERRYEPVTIGKDIDLQYILESRDRIWSAARALYLAGVPYWTEGREAFEAAKVRKDSYILEDTMGGRVREIAHALALGGGLVTISGIWRQLCGGDPAADSRLDRSKQTIIGKALRKSGEWTIQRNDKGYFYKLTIFPDRE